jgi:hypothetical protein
MSSSLWLRTVSRTTSSPWGSTSWPPSPLLPRGTHSACLSWRSTFPFLLRPQSLELILSPSLPLFLGGLGGAFTPSDRRPRRFPKSLREVCVPGGGRSPLDLKPQEHTPSRSGRFKPLSEHGGRHRARGGLSPLSIPSSVGYGGRHDSGGGPSASYSHRSVGGHPPRSPPLSEVYPSPTRSELGGGSDSSDIHQDSSKNSLFWGSSSSDSAVDCRPQARGASFASHSHRSVGGHPPRSPPLSEAYSSPTRFEIFNGG